MHVHQAGSGTQAAFAVDGFRILCVDSLADGADRSVLQKNVRHGSIPARGGIDHFHIFQQNSAHCFTTLP